MNNGNEVPMPDSNPPSVRLERVEGGYRYDLGETYRTGGTCYEIQQIKQPGATFEGWWEIGIEGDDTTYVMAPSLTAVRRFLAATPHYGKLSNR